MKYYGVFYKDGSKWYGPYLGESFLKSESKDMLRLAKQCLKRKVELRVETWVKAR